VVVAGVDDDVQAAATNATARSLLSIVMTLRGRDRLREASRPPDMQVMALDAAPPALALHPVDEALAAEWAALADATGALPFAHPQWVVPWARAAGRDLGLLTVRRHGGLAAVLPLCGERTLSTAADWHVPEACAVWADTAAAEALAAALASSSVARITLDFVASGSPTHRVLAAALESAGRTLHTRVRARSPFIDLSPGWDQYRDGLSAKKLRELRRRMRRLEDEGAVEFTVHDGAAGLDGLLEEAFTVEAAGWKGEAGTAIAADPALERFYRGVAAWAATEGMLRLQFLRVGGRPIAFDLALVSDGREWLLKTGFDPGMRRHAPGQHLRLFAIRSAFERGLAAYEFAGSADAWKLEWTASTRPVLAIEAFAPGMAGTTARVRFRLGRAARALRSRLAPG
jgi:CelD/BcsL family acetyltransferase involved in cellulose biosynthesis